MRLLPILMLAGLLAACGDKSEEGNSGTVQTGIDRANADIRAAQAAASREVELNRSVGELTGKAGKDRAEEPAEDQTREGAPAKAPVAETTPAPAEATAVPPAAAPAQPAQ